MSGTEFTGAALVSDVVNTVFAGRSITSEQFASLSPRCRLPFLIRRFLNPVQVSTLRPILHLRLQTPLISALNPVAVMPSTSTSLHLLSFPPQSVALLIRKEQNEIQNLSHHRQNENDTFLGRRNSPHLNFFRERISSLQSLSIFLNFSLHFCPSSASPNITSVETTKHCQSRRACPTSQRIALHYCALSISAKKCGTL